MCRLKTKGIALGVTLALLAGVAAGWAVEKRKTPAAESATSSGVQSSGVAYLGVGVESLYRPLASHLPSLFSSGQGVLVTSVAPQSPADRAGITSDDVLMTYGDQKLFSPEQLAKLVKSDKIGNEVKLELIHQGNAKQVTVTLSNHELGSELSTTTSKLEHEWWGWRLPDWQSRHWHMPRWFTQTTSPSTEHSQWQSFDSMTIKSLGDSRFHAEIQYLDKDGKVDRREFEGTREEVHKAIMAQKDLPDTEREHLLRSLDLPNEGLVVPSLQIDPEHGFMWDFETPDQVL